MDEQEEIIGTVEAKTPESAYGLHNTNGFFNPSLNPNRKRIMFILEKEKEAKPEPKPTFSKESDQQVIELLEKWRALQDEKNQKHIQTVERMREHELEEIRKKRELEATKAWL